MKILASSYISPTRVFLNQERKMTFQDANWLKEAYQLMALDYPKFYKMDNLSKMTVLATEWIKSTGLLNDLADNELELIFANTNASQHTDMKFLESYQQLGNPSPSLFVYTLPNILTGELAIKNKWFGENTFFIQPEFDAQLFTDRLYHSSQKETTLCLCGWVDSKVNTKNETELEECFLFLVSLNKTESKNDRGLLSKTLTELLTSYRNV